MLSFACFIYSTELSNLGTGRKIFRLYNKNSNCHQKQGSYIIAKAKTRCFCKYFIRACFTLLLILKLKIPIMKALWISFLCALLHASVKMFCVSELWIQ